MRASATTAWPAITALLAALALGAAMPVAAQPAPWATKATPDADAPSPPEAQTPAPVEPAEEPQAAAEPAGPREPPQFGVSRRIDPFDENDEVPAPAGVAPANLKLGAVVCVAGCDTPRAAAVRVRN